MHRLDHVEFQIGEVQDLARWRDLSAQQRMDARQQLLEAERLDEVVVRTGFETRDAIAHLVARGQHEDGDLVAGGAQPTGHLETVHARQHHVEHHEMRQVLARLIERLFACFRLDDAITLISQAAPDDGSNLWVVVDDQYAGWLAHVQILWAIP